MVPTFDSDLGASLFECLWLGVLVGEGSCRLQSSGSDYLIEALIFCATLFIQTFVISLCFLRLDCLAVRDDPACLYEGFVCLLTGSLCFIVSCGHCLLILCFIVRAAVA